MPFGDFLSGYHDVAGQLVEYVRNKAGDCFKKEKEEKENIVNIAQHEARKARIRKCFLDAIGGLDIEKTPLNCTCTGVLDREGYTISKLIYQSQPGFYVTASLYKPAEADGKLPAVIFACGHFESAKAADEYQRVCIDLVKNGFIVLTPDPIGQGERMQYYDPEAERPLVNWGTTEHTYAGMQCALTGSGIARYFVWDLIRSVDLLCSMPEVDSARIGITGNSGGGMQTAYMMLADDRIQAAMPCTWITSREAFMKSGHSLDGEQVLFGIISEGLNCDDFVSCFAPKPVMIGAVESDYFAPEGTKQSLERAKKVYELYGKGDLVALSLTEGRHSYNDAMRQDAVNWFIKHLKGGKGDFVTCSSMKLEDRELLRCTASGQVMAEFDDARSVFDLNLEYYRMNRYSNGCISADIKGRVRKVLNLPEGKGPIHARIVSEYNRGPIRYEDATVNYRELFFFSEENVAVSGIYISDTLNKGGRCTVLLLDEGMQSYGLQTDLVRRLIKKGDVFVFEPRGVGSVRSRDINYGGYYDIHGTIYKLNCDLMMMKTSMAALSVYDTLKAIEYVRKAYPGIKTGLAGKGISAVYALLAAFLDDGIDQVYLEDMINSFEDLVSHKYYKFDVRLGIHGILKHFDLPCILKACEDKSIVRFSSPDIGPYAGNRAF